ncbi:MAG: AlwI family type II restriction endonuclease [Treponema sp.]|uniref:AlwI family type II restriction endonuclease n=1 Tax=Treponema sp. TaxID=166 RepID=UPI0025D7BFAF|nr:AlwI family type II restriction endonuclease [Treponema sp.]MBR0496989.1 AlwI family type II restriction endonuclease [Treponema sp.]
MSEENIAFKSFYYSLGTTSFRMQNFNQKIEQQLDLLNQFWQKPEYTNEKWESNESVQEAYYNFIKERGFLKDGEAPRKAKDARQKTSGMRDIGLIDDNRRLTDVGKKLLEISKNGDFSSDNFLQIPKDSFIYFQQLLKTYIAIDKDTGIRPFVLLARLLKNFNYLNKEEFMYLFPLCISRETTKFIESKLYDFRGKGISVDDIVTEIFMQQQNYKDALDFFISEKIVTEETFCRVGLNRKSKNYDRAYLPLYNAIKVVYFDGDNSTKEILNLYEASDIGNVKTHWRKFLFKTSSSASIKKSPLTHLQLANMFSNLGDEVEFKTVFFKTMHLIKIKKTLEDYFDLNRRYLKISDTLLFADEQVKFDVIPKYYFSLLTDEFYNLAFEKSDKVAELQTLEEISPFLKLDEAKLLKAINKDNKTSFSQIADIKQFVADERTERFNKLIDEKFSDTQLIYILQLISKRADKEIQELVTDDADIPTIFEYILGIAWYKISERKGDILSFMNLSLEADLLPKTHAGGGEADLVFQYEAENGYPKHTLLIEATLADSTNQRRMEMEPVSRHLGEYMLAHKDLDSYCVFITNFLHINVISDFRNRRKMEYYGGRNGEEVINGMMITPLENELLIAILQKGVKYPQLYRLFHELQESPLAPKEWYADLKEKIALLK